MKKIILSAGLAVLLTVVIVGLFVPLGSYTSTKGCDVDPVPIKRLHVVLGESLSDVKARDVTPAPNAGCSPNTKSVLYLL